MSKMRAIYTGFVGHEGVPVQLADGDEYDAEHPLVAARPDLFVEVPVPAPKRSAVRVPGRAKASDKAADKAADDG